MDKYFEKGEVQPTLYFVVDAGRDSFDGDALSKSISDEWEMDVRILNVAVYHPDMRESMTSRFVRIN